MAGSVARSAVCSESSPSGRQTAACTQLLSLQSRRPFLLELVLEFVCLVQCDGLCLVKRCQIGGMQHLRRLLGSNASFAASCAISLCCAVRLRDKIASLKQLIKQNKIELDAVQEEKEVAKQVCSAQEEAREVVAGGRGPACIAFSQATERKMEDLAGAGNEYKTLADARQVGVWCLCWCPCPCPRLRPCPCMCPCMCLCQWLCWCQAKGPVRQSRREWAECGWSGAAEYTELAVVVLHAFN